jgi:hypothetical protein
VRQIHRDILNFLGWLSAAAVVSVVFSLVVVPAIWSLASPPPLNSGETVPPPSLYAPSQTECNSDAVQAGVCVATDDYAYTGVLSTENVLFGQLYFRVLTPTGANYTAMAHGKFTIMNSGGAIVASFTLPMTGPLAMASPTNWTYYTAETGVSNQSAFTSLFTVWVDTGTVNPSGAGDLLEALFTGTYAGYVTTSVLP